MGVPEPVWFRQRRETPRAYKAFVLYTEMGESRTLRLVAQELGHKNAKTVEMWSSKYKWVARSQAYDDDQQRIASLKFHQDRQRSIIAQAKLGQDLREKASMALVGLDPDEMAAGEIVRMAEVGVKIERLAYGDSTENESNSQTVQFVLGEVPVWAASQVEDKAEADDARSIPASPNARPLAAKTHLLLEQVERGEHA